MHFFFKKNSHITFSLGPWCLIIVLANKCWFLRFWRLFFTIILYISTTTVMQSNSYYRFFPNTQTWRKQCAQYIHPPINCIRNYINFFYFKCICFDKIFLNLFYENVKYKCVYILGHYNNRTFLILCFKTGNLIIKIN